jgi:hypothetical protein
MQLAVLLAIITSIASAPIASARDERIETMATVVSLDGPGWAISNADGKHKVEGTVPGYALQALVEAGMEQDPLSG